jgi:hypothetical protein
MEMTVRKRVFALVGAVLVVLGFAIGSASAGTGNTWLYAMNSPNRDGLVIQGVKGPNNNILLVRDHLGQPIFNVLEAGGASVMGDNFRVLAGDDIANAVVTVSPKPPAGPCPKENALWVGPGNIWKCIRGSWRAPRVPLW